MTTSLITGTPVVVDVPTKLKQPCIIFLHGDGEKGNGTADGTKNLQGFIYSPDSNIKAIIDADFNGEAFGILAPQMLTTDYEWQNEYIDKAVNHALTLPEVDPTRISLIGVSRGGAGVLKYLSVPGNGAKFNVAVAICPAWSTFDWKVIASSGIALWLIHAVDDNLCDVGTTNSAYSNILAANPKAIVHKTIYPSGGHYIWARALNPTIPPGVNGETVTVPQWALMNTNKIHKPVPSTTIIPPVMATLTAKAGPDQIITGTTATLDGSASTGWKQAWWIADSPGVTMVNFAGVNKNWGIKVDLKDLKPGDYQFRLTVSDGVNKAEDIVKIKVQAAVVIPPTTTKKLIATIKVYDDGSIEKV